MLLRAFLMMGKSLFSIFRLFSPSERVIICFCSTEWASQMRILASCGKMLATLRFIDLLCYCYRQSASAECTSIVSSCVSCYAKVLWPLGRTECAVVLRGTLALKQRLDGPGDL